jgi:hypothetical protein
MGLEFVWFQMPSQPTIQQDSKPPPPTALTPANPLEAVLSNHTYNCC